MSVKKVQFQIDQLRKEGEIEGLRKEIETLETDDESGGDVSFLSRRGGVPPDANDKPPHTLIGLDAASTGGSQSYSQRSTQPLRLDAASTGGAQPYGQPSAQTAGPDAASIGGDRSSVQHSTQQLRRDAASTGGVRPYVPSSIQIAGLDANPIGGSQACKLAGLIESLFAEQSFAVQNNRTPGPGNRSLSNRRIDFNPPTRPIIGQPGGAICHSVANGTMRSMVSAPSQYPLDKKTCQPGGSSGPPYQPLKQLPTDYKFDYKMPGNFTENLDRVPPATRTSSPKRRLPQTRHPGGVGAPSILKQAPVRREMTHDIQPNYSNIQATQHDESIAGIVEDPTTWKQKKGISADTSKI